MERENYTGHKFVWLPTNEQELLLKAGLFDCASAISAWQNWRKLVEITNISEAEARLLPLVYHNLQKLNYSDDLTIFLKQAHRGAYNKTQIHLQTAEKLITILNNSGIRMILLKGAALGIMYYDSIALRPMSDLDLLIKPGDFSKAVEILKTHNWEPQEKDLALLVEILQACDFKDPAGKELDLHWRLMRDCWNADKNDVFWEAAVPLRRNSLITETLSPTDQLFHACCHGARYNPVSPIRWIADALMILRSPFEIDWQRLYKLGKFYRLNITLFHALSYIRKTFNAPIPTDYLNQVRESPKTRLEKLSFGFYSEAPKAWTIARFVQEAAIQYSAQTSSTHLRPRSRAFVKYLQYFLTGEKILKKLSPPKIGNGSN